MTEQSLVTTPDAELADMVATETLPEVTPAVDLIERDDAFVLTADLPGVSKEQLELQLEADALLLSATTAAVTAPEGSHPVVAEVGPRRYVRRFRVGDTIDRDRVDAQLVDGVLTVTLPKSPAVQPRRIEVG